MVSEGQQLWQPGAARIASARVTQFASWLAQAHGVHTGDYDDLWRWSVADVGAFWECFAQWYGVRWHQPPARALGARTMPGAEWFPDGTLNYAEHLLYPPCGAADADVAVVFAREDAPLVEVSWGQLRAQVAALRSALLELGVRAGDRVVALVPNSPEALVAMLATASIGAIWSSCSPDFGPQAVADRFCQVEPVVLFAVDGYRYGGKAYDIGATMSALRERLPSLRAAVLVPYLNPEARTEGMLAWPDLIAREGELTFAALAFDAPLWILYSSGTTGLPKPIVHCHGGMLIEHAKQLALHLDLGPGDRFFWFTTTGWMMWNLLVSGLAVGATLVMYDGSPGYPDLDALWQLAEQSAITCFGTSAPFVQSCLKAGLEPAAAHDLSRLHTLGSTGAPLSPEGFEWVYAQVGSDLALSSVSGGTDVCTAFVGGVPTLPVHAGEIPCRCLGCDVQAFDPDGRPLVDEVGELVLTQPMPSMPVAFWNDPDGARLRDAYFDTYPGVWRHGDWIKITPRGSCVIYGRSDSTLNRDGVRMGTAEFYRVVDEAPGVADSLVVDTSAAGHEGELLLFVVLAEGATLEEVTADLRPRIRTQLSPRHVPNRILAIAQVPRTVNGKKCEVPVKRILAGVAPEQAVSTGALNNPAAMDPFVALAAELN